MNGRNMQRVAGYPDEYLRQEAPVSQPVPITKDLACSCPMLCADIQGSLTPLPIDQLKVHVDVHVSMAFVELELQSSMPASWQSSEHLVLFLPKAYNSTVTNLAVHDANSGQVRATMEGAAAHAAVHCRHIQQQPHVSQQQSHDPT